MQKPQVVFQSDESEVIVVKGGFFWIWWEPEPGEEFIPKVSAAAYLRGSGREDIAAAVEAYLRGES